MNKNIKEAKRKFEILLVGFIIFQILILFFINAFLNNFLLEIDIDNSEIILIKKIITIFIITISIIIDIVIYKKYICGLNSLINTTHIRGVIEDFIIYPYGYDNSHPRKIDYRISPVVRSVEDNQLYFTFGNYSLSYYTSIETKINNKVLSKTIFRGDGSEVKVGDIAFIYIKRKLDINVEIDEDNNRVKLDNLKMNFLHENNNYNIDVFNKIIFFEGITEIEDIRDTI